MPKKKPTKIDQSSTKPLVTVVVILVLIVIALAIYFWFGTGDGEDQAVNTNANQQDVNKYQNLNLNLNLNANANENANENTNDNLNENTNENTNENINSNTNLNANANTNTNTSASVPGTENWQDFESELLGATMKVHSSWYYNIFYGEEVGDYTMIVTFSPEESIIEDEATWEDGDVTLRVISKSVNPTEYESLKSDVNSVVIEDDGSKLYVLYSEFGEYQATMSLMAKTFSFTE